MAKEFGTSLLSVRLLGWSWPLCSGLGIGSGSLYGGVVGGVVGGGGALLLRLALKQTPYQLLSLCCWLLAVGCWLLAFCLRRAINCCC